MNKQVYCDGFDEDMNDSTHPGVFYTLKEDYKEPGVYRAVCFYCGRRWEETINNES